MSPEDVLKLIKAARKQFKDEMWGHDDDTAVDAYIKLLKQLVSPPPVRTPKPGKDMFGKRTVGFGP